MPEDLFKPKHIRNVKWRTYSPRVPGGTTLPEYCGKSAHFLALPLEIRLDIYELLIWQHDSEQPAGDLDTATALLYTCRQTFIEVSSYIVRIFTEQIKLLDEECSHRNAMLLKAVNQTDRINHKFHCDIVRVRIERAQKRFKVAENRAERAKGMDNTNRQGAKVSFTPPC
jgi:hypothetical protein